jgi:hypothetical protein
VTRHALAAAVLSAAALAGCGDGDDEAATTASAPPKPTVVADRPRHPTFEEVERASIPIFQRDPECPIAEWHENSTGLDAKYRKSVAFFRQLDCLKAEGSIPDKIQQSLYVQFRDRRSLERYLRAGHAGQRPEYLRSDTILVTVGSGLDALDAPAYLEAISAICNCGRIGKSSG